jgi:acyl carrier protein
MRPKPARRRDGKRPSQGDLHGRTKETILKYVIEEYADEDDKVTFDTPLISSGLVDSFSMVSLKRFLEVKYKISIPDEDASPAAFDSVTKIAELVTRFTS